MRKRAPRTRLVASTLASSASVQSLEGKKAAAEWLAGILPDPVRSPADVLREGGGGRARPDGETNE